MLTKHEIFTYKEIKKLCLLHAKREKIWLKFSWLFIFWSSFFLYLLLKSVEVCHFSTPFWLFLNYLTYNILSIFSNFNFFFHICDCRWYSLQYWFRMSRGVKLFLPVLWRNLSVLLSILLKFKNNYVTFRVKVLKKWSSCCGLINFFRF